MQSRLSRLRFERFEQAVPVFSGFFRRCRAGCPGCSCSGCSSRLVPVAERKRAEAARETIGIDLGDKVSRYTILADVIKCGCTLQDARDFGGSNTVYATYFKTNPPTRTTAVTVHVLDGRVEIDCVAYKPLG